MSVELPLVTRGDQIEAHDGVRVRMRGRYVRVDVRMKPRPPPRLLGHAAIVLDDGAHVSLLPTWSPDAIRPVDEQDACADREVEVIGTLHAIAPREPHGGACPISPAFGEVTSVRRTG